MKCLQKMASFAMAVIMLLSAVCFTNVTQVAAAEIIPVYLNGQRLEFPANDAQPQIYQNRTYVPIRKTAEYLGLEITWNAKTETLTFSREGLTIDHTMRSNIVYVSGKPLTFDTRSINVQNRTLMPIRMLGESIGATVDWNSTERAVYITTNGASVTESTTAAQPSSPSSSAPQIESAKLSKSSVGVGEKIKVSVTAKDATKIKLIDSESRKEIETIDEFGDDNGVHTFDTLITADNETGDTVTKGIIVVAGDNNKFYEDLASTRTLTYSITADKESSKKDDDDDDDDDDKQEKIKSDYLKSYKLDKSSYDEDDTAVITVVTTDDVSKVRITNNFNSSRAEASEYKEKNDQRTFEVKTRLSKKGSIYLYICLYIEDEGYEAVSQKVSVKVGKDSGKSYDDLEIVDTELLNDTVYLGEQAHLVVYTSTDVAEVSVYNEDDKKVASSYYNNGKEDGKLVWDLSFKVDHSDRKKYTIYAYDENDNKETETIKIEGTSFSKSDAVVLSVEQKTSNVKEGDTCKFTVKCTSAVSYIALATSSGKEIEVETSGSKSGSYKTFTIRGEIDDLDDDYKIIGYDDNDSKESTYKFRVRGSGSDEVEIISVDVEDTRVDIDDDIELTVETSTNVKKLTITDQDDNRVLRKSSPTSENSTKYVWELSFNPLEEGRNTFTITVEDNDDNTDEWDFNVYVDD